ncbi:MAG: 6-phosphogluconolactonase [Planctomycetes bacterium]|nr:6-phosphogluconolactonase [Planctomycetota bacterium]
MLPYQADTVAEALFLILDQVAAKKGRATLAIPGGRSPGPVLTSLAAMCGEFLRSRLHLLWLDERAVPRGDHDRNDAPTLAAWSAGGALPAFVHPMPAEDAELERAADAYARTLRDATVDGVIDACLVGIGEDGHCASLFPNHPGLRELSDVFVVTDSPKPPPRRLTLSLPVLRRASHAIILALGEAKGDVARRARRGPDPAIPVSLLRQEVCLWYLDDAAMRAAGGS